MLADMATSVENGRNRKVLVVDDTEDVRFMIPLQLRTDGVTFEEAASGEEALVRCGSEVFDAIVLDYRMPGLTGLDVAKRLQADNYPAQLVIYSAYVDESLADDAQTLEIPVVDKADHGRLREVVRSALGLVEASR